MDVLPQTCLHEDVPRIPPLLNFSTVTMSFTGALPRKTNTFSFRGSLFFWERWELQGKEEIIAPPKPHIHVNNDIILPKNMWCVCVCVTHAYTVYVMREFPAFPVCGTLSSSDLACYCRFGSGLRGWITVDLVEWAIVLSLFTLGQDPCA